MHRIALRTAAAAALLSLAAPSPARAQRAAPPLVALRTDAPAAAPGAYRAPALQEQARPPSEVALALGGIAGGAVGTLVGAAAGFALETSLTQCQGDEFCGVGGILLGGAAGEVLGIPFGVHQVNRRRGRYGEGVVVTLLVGLAGIGLASQMQEAGPVMAVAVPAAQLVAAVAVERASGARKPPR
ncbi:MAG: hypothetical protein ABW277_25920 [Longimicrobiaceae bacterium]